MRHFVSAPCTYLLGIRPVIFRAAANGYTFSWKMVVEGLPTTVWKKHIGRLTVSYLLLSKSKKYRSAQLCYILDRFAFTSDVGSSIRHTTMALSNKTNINLLHGQKFYVGFALNNTGCVCS